MASVKLKQVEKQYPNGFKAVHGVDLDIHDGEFMVFVGPSGCAKSTTLRMIAGLESITSGEIWIGEQCVNNLLPKDRGISMVFQNYALYPHMSVYQNMSFGLKNAGFSKDEIDKRVHEAATKLEILDLLDRKPKEMSGGQSQRVAVGRAIVRKPDVFLFDEPLSNLDAKLRVSMRVSLMTLHRNLKEEGVSATMIYVTHDQVEAMTMGDRICVLNFGEIMQVDTPINLYHYPNNKFVAGFIGSPAMNILKIPYSTLGVNILNKGVLPWPQLILDNLPEYSHSTVWFGLRPEHISVSQIAMDNQFAASIVNVERMGNEDLLHCQMGEHSLVVRTQSNPSWLPKIGDSVYLGFDLNHAHLFDIETEKSILDRREFSSVLDQTSKETENELVTVD